LSITVTVPLLFSIAETPAPEEGDRYVSGLSTGKKLLLLGLLLVVVVTALRYSVGGMGRFSPLASSLRDILSPIQRGMMIAGRELGDFIATPGRLIGLTKRYQQLEEQNSQLESQLLQFKEISEENSRLKGMLDFSTNMASQMTTKAAAVTGRDYGNWLGTITINKGAAQGINSNMAVITPAGLVGRVTRVSKNTAEVLLITDSRSGVGSMVQETRAPGIVEGVSGGKGSLVVVNIPPDLTPSPGDRVITSGLDGSIFPKGIPIGTVRNVRKDEAGLFKMADVEPYVDFNRLEEVLVVTSLTLKTP